MQHSTDEIQRLAPSTSTEELNQEMANLEGLMKDLSAITANEFECWMGGADGVLLDGPKEDTVMNCLVILI